MSTLQNMVVKLPITKFLINSFFVWTLATSATSRGCNFNLSNLNRVIDFSEIFQISYEILLVGLKWKWGGVRVRFPKWVDSTPFPRVFNWPKSPGFSGLRAVSLISVFSKEILWSVHSFSSEVLDKVYHILWTFPVESRFWNSQYIHRNVHKLYIREQYWWNTKHRDCFVTHLKRPLSKFFLKC